MKGKGVNDVLNATVVISIMIALIVLLFFIGARVKPIRFIVHRSVIIGIGLLFFFFFLLFFVSIFLHFLLLFFIFVYLMYVLFKFLFIFCFIYFRCSCDDFC